MENDSYRQFIDLLNGNWPWMGNVVWFVDGGIWGMEDGRIGRIANGGNLKLSVYAVCTNNPYHTETSLRFPTN